MTKQTARCQSVGDKLQKCVRLFRYSYWLPRKSILKLVNLHQMRARKNKNIWNIEKASQTLKVYSNLKIEADCPADRLDAIF